MQYPDEKLTHTSKYSYAEICAALDQWEQVETRYNAVLAELPDYSALSAELQDEITWLEPIVCPMDGAWHRSGNAEMFPVKKWNKLIAQHKRLVSRIQALRKNEQIH